VDYKTYKAQISADVAALIAKKSCQPILFIGAGFSRRYCGAPSWEDLLTDLGQECPNVERDYAYYRQSRLTMPQIGSKFATAYKEWAWDAGKAKFPAKFFKPDIPEDIFIKYAIARKLESLGPDQKGSFGAPDLDAEIVALKAIHPHAVITTNYDRLLEPIFEDYEPVIGQQVIRHAYMSIGEVFKIHGCITDPESLTLTAEDYTKFSNDKKYLSAKLFTYFVEHPLLFIGYSATDENIQSILQEIDHMLPAGVGLVDNIYILEWDSKINNQSFPPTDKIIDLGKGRTIRIRSITADSFEWVFRAFQSEAPLEKVNVKLLRSISHRVLDLVRTDAAKNVVEINFEMLNHALENPGDFAKVFGIAAMSDPSLLNVMYPYTPTSGAKAAGYTNWTYLYKLLDKLKVVHNFDMRSSDNKYHVRIPSGENSGMTKFSQAGIDLLVRVKGGLDLPDLTNTAITGVKKAAEAP
jgi:hypothetical protein